MENQYFRLLDVRIAPGDTTLYHIHSSPSVFTYFTNTHISLQVKGKPWTSEDIREGQVAFRDFTKDTLVHRVTNIDQGSFHVTDLELLSPYVSKFPFHQLPYKVLFDNDKVIAYQWDAASFNDHINSTHGPMLAELVKGSGVAYHDIVTKKLIPLKAGKFLYIPPGNTFQFTTQKEEDVNLILFEIK